MNIGYARKEIRHTSRRPLKATTASSTAKATATAATSSLLSSVNEDLTAAKVLAAHAKGFSSSLQAVELDMSKALGPASLSVNSCTKDTRSVSKAVHWMVQRLSQYINSRTQQALQLTITRHDHLTMAKAVLTSSAAEVLTQVKTNNEFEVFSCTGSMMVQSIG